MQYRIWIKRENQFSTDCERFAIKPNGAIVDWADSEEQYSNADYVVQSYTGLKDKNGKEICEGDIVECEFALQAGKNIGVVEYNDFYTYFGVKIIKSAIIVAVPKVSKPFLNFYSGSENRKLLVKVIGNIFENPELIKN